MTYTIDILCSVLFGIGVGLVIAEFFYRKTICFKSGCDNRIK